MSWLIFGTASDWSKGREPYRLEEMTSYSLKMVMEGICVDSK